MISEILKLSLWKTHLFLFFLFHCGLEKALLKACPGPWIALRNPGSKSSAREKLLIHILGDFLESLDQEYKHVSHFKDNHVSFYEMTFKCILQNTCFNSPIGCMELGN